MIFGTISSNFKEKGKLRLIELTQVHGMIGYQWHVCNLILWYHFTLIIPPLGEGILGCDPVWTSCALSVRQHPKVYEVFVNLLQSKELMVNHDR